MPGATPRFELRGGERLVRMWLFAISTFISVAWTALLCVEVYLYYEQSDHSQLTLVALLIGTYAFTAGALPALCAREFLHYVEGIILAICLSLQITFGLLFTIIRPTFACPTGATQHKLCENINLIILICSWVVPAILIWYAAFLYVMYRMRDRKLQETRPIQDQNKHQSVLPIQHLVPHRPPRPAMTSDSRTSISVYSQATASRSHLPSQLPPPPAGALQVPPGQRQTPFGHMQTPHAPSRLAPGYVQTLSGPSQVPPVPSSVPQSSRPPRAQPPPHLPLHHNAYTAIRPPSHSPHSSQNSSQMLSVRSSQRVSQPSVYSSSQGSSRDSRRLTMPMSHLPSNLPSPVNPQASSRVFHRITTALPPQPEPIDENDDDSSRKSSGRLSKPPPLNPIAFAI